MNKIRDAGSRFAYDLHYSWFSHSFFHPFFPIYFIISKADMILSCHFAVLFSFRALLNADMMLSGTGLASWNTYVDIYSY